MRLLFFLTLLLGAFLPTRSQTLNFVNYTTKDGLLSDDVYNMYQDKAGYLWVFSKFGTVKYDGFVFKKVFKNLSFSEGFVYSVYEQPSGKIWIANSKGRIYEVRNDSAIRLNSTVMEKVTAALESRGDEIIGLKVTSKSDYYVLTKGYSYKINNDQYTSINLANVISNDSAMYRLNVLPEGTVLFSSRRMADGHFYYNQKDRVFYVEVIDNKGVHRYRDADYEKSLLIKNSHPRGVKTIDGAHYFANANSIVRLSGNEKFTYFILPAYILNFAIDANGHFWIACLNNGLYETDNSGNILNHYLGNVTINDVRIDHQGGLWATSEGNGIFYCKNFHEKYYLPGTLLGGQKVSMKIEDGFLYVANERGDLSRLGDNGNWETLCKGDSTELWDYTKFNGRLLVTSMYGMASLTNGRKIPWKPKAYDVGFRRLISQKKDTLVCVHRKVIAYCVNETVDKGFYVDKKILSITLIRDTFYIGTDQGVYTWPYKYSTPGKTFNGKLVYDTIKLVQPLNLNPTHKSTIVNIVDDYHGNIWFCTEGEGLYKFKGGVLTKLNNLNGLPDNSINHLCVCPNKKVLLSTNSGLFISNGEGLISQKTSWTRLVTGRVKQAFFYNDRIYFASRQGLIDLDYSNIRERPRPLLSLLSVNVDSSAIEPQNFTELSSSQRGLSFDFKIIDFRELKSAIGYRLVGTLNDSGSVVGTRLRLGQLPIGQYTLYVFSEPLTKNAEIALPFKVTPTFFETTFFKIMVAVALLIAMVLVYQQLLKNRKKKEAVKLKNEQLILEYKLIALKAQVNPHFMSNCLSAIQNMVLESDREKATYYLAEFGMLMRKILEHSSKQTISLAEELELLALYIELERLRFDNKFTYQVHVSRKIDPKKFQVPPLILNPIVENAIWHGLLPIHDKRQARLTLDAYIENNSLVIVVEDNGIGIKKIEPGISNNKTDSFGLQITEQRISNWNYLQQGQQATFSIKNLENSNVPSSGTRVTINLPIVHHGKD